jgi:hypothetical protein
MAARNLIRIDNTRFIFETNFAGDPERDRYGSEARKGNIIIPDYEQAMDLIDMGFNVKTTKPREGEEENFVPKYYVSVKVNFDTDWPPKIYLVSGDAEPVKLDEESIDLIDTCYVLNVNVILNPYTDKRTGRKSLYVRTMYVEQDVEEDPYASRYGRN